MGMSTMFLRFLEAIYDGAQNRVKWNEQFFEFYALLSGVRLGDPLSAALFVIYIAAVTAAVTQGRTTSIHIGHHELSLPKYADDVVLIWPRSHHLQKSIDRVVQFSGKNHLIVNSRKSVTIVVRSAKRCWPRISVRVDGIEWEQFEVFRYLRFPFNSPALSFSVRKRFSGML